MSQNSEHQNKISLDSLLEEKHSLEMELIALISQETNNNFKETSTRRSIVEDRISEINETFTEIEKAISTYNLSQRELDNFESILLRSQASNKELKLRIIDLENKIKNDRGLIEKVNSEAEELFKEKMEFELERSESLQKIEDSKNKILSSFREIADKQNELNLKTYEIENKDKIKENAVRIINSAYEKRKSEKERLSYTSYLYAALMTIMIFIGLSTLYQVYKDTSFFYEKNITWTTAIFYLLKNFFLLAGYIVAIRFLAQFSDKYFKAAQEEENRIHNMTYGKFYVETYASVVDTEEIKEALSDWRTKPSKSEEETSSTTSNVEADSSMPQFSNKDLKEILPKIDSLLQRIKPAIDKSDKDSNISK